MTRDALGLPPAPPAATESAFVIELDQFSGPLDLLLSLIREEQLEIRDIPIARVCEQFLARIHDLGLSEAAEYLEMAAGLLRIKVQMLLPRRGGDEAWEDPRAELVRRLLEYQQVREIVDVLEGRSEDRRNRLPRGYLPVEVVTVTRPLALALPELLAAVDRVLRLARRPSVHEVVPRALDVDGAIDIVLGALELRARLRWTQIVAGDAEPWQVLSALLALLELSRRGDVTLRQPRPFADVDILRDAASQAA